MRRFKDIAVKSFSSNFMGLVASVLFNALLIKVFIKSVGINIFGIYTLMTSIVGFSGLMDFGLGNSITKFVAEYNKKNPVLLKHYINTTFWATLIFASGFCAAFILVSKLPIYGFLGVQETDYVLARDLLAMSGILFFSIMMFSFMGSVLQGFLMYTTFNIANVIRSALRVVIAVFVLDTAVSVKSFIMYCILSNMALCLGIGLLLLKEKGISFRVRYFKTVLVPKIFSYSAFIFSNNMLGNIYYRIDKVIVSHFVGTERLAFYYVPFTVAVNIVTSTSKLLNFLFPVAANIFAGRESGDKEKVYLKSVFYVVIIAGTFAFSANFLGSIYLKYWIGNDFYMGCRNILFILSSVFYFSGLGVVPYYFFNGMGMPKINLLCSSVGIAIYLPFAVILTKLYGVTGAAAALIGGLIPFPFYFFAAHRKVGCGNARVVTYISVGYFFVICSIIMTRILL